MAKLTQASDLEFAKLFQLHYHYIVEYRFQNTATAPTFSSDLKGTVYLYMDEIFSLMFTVFTAFLPQSSSIGRWFI